MSGPAFPIPLQSIEDTLALGRQLGLAAQAGDVIALCGCLGSGKTHLGRIYGKLGVETRAGAVAVAKERRLLP